ncbi:hypothetical protein SAMN04487969_110164 [Paenibacillus algorifonticola]|uniref:Bacteriocin (Lactococcin_972) n=1 Tax=Paenibacillus algorifonticola TaxID=684063 RepID=A0A1I2EZZ6_9BACL|nr:hypothetical protein [Paenibacillus algorifonticola]SFE98167.1 hypothetical protein SAMN04487969_110164 [Paenibacillus algorifonticola]
MKKAIFCSVLALGLVVSSSSAFAATVTKNSSGKTFTKSWELTASGGSWLMKYGFNTDFINEDYTHTYNSQFHHTATVSNSNGAFTDEDSAGSWAGIEVTHSGTYIEYSISY